ncbi:MAG: DUF3467 domain-containing protein [Calditrichaeota bacterium]|nr:MAG: DUF3467 domain-containing protein [Calditrichota bacterium]
MSNNQPQQINIQIGEKEAEGIYVNLAIISHSPAEFIFDFTRVLPGIPKTKVYARVIMTPQHAKSFLNALKENVAKYESQFGEIKVISEPPKPNQPIGFQPQTEATDENSTTTA